MRLIRGLSPLLLSSLLAFGVACPGPDGGGEVGGSVLPDGGSETPGGAMGDGGLGQPGGAMGDGGLGQPDGSTAGVDGGTSPEPEYLSGSRLKARVARSAEGAESLLHWFDSKLQFACSALVTSPNGRRHCLPVNEPLLYDYSGYADASCTQPLLAAWTPGCTVPSMVSLPTNVSACGVFGSVMRVVRVGARHLGKRYSKNGASCLETTGGAAEVYLMGAEVPLSELVEFEEQRTPLTAKLSKSTLRGADGSRQVANVMVGSTAATCSFSDAADGVRRCLPQTTASLSTARFSDAACARQAVVESRNTTGSGAACPLPASVIEPAQSCPGRARVYSVGAETKGYAKGSAGVCTEVSTGEADRNRYFALGQELPPQSFEAVPTAMGAAFGRLVRRENDFGAGGRLSFGWNDTQLGVPCFTGLAEDGKQRCLPSEVASFVERYADAACTQQLAYTTASCTQPAFAMNWTIGCSTQISVARVAGPHTGPIYSKGFTSTGTRCDLDTSPLVNQQAWRVGAKLPASTFVEMNVTVR